MLLKETLFSRFNSPEYILSFEYEEGLEMIIEGLKKEEEKKLWQLWLIKYPFMSEKNFISFDEFKEQSFKSTKNFNVNEETTEEIEERVKAIIDLTIKERG